MLDTQPLYRSFNTMKSNCVLFVALVVITSTAVAQTGSLQDLSRKLESLPEITIYSAKEILTLDPAKPSAQAVALVNDRVLVVGSVEELKAAAGQQRVMVDDTFANKVIVPGFIAQHDHPMLAAVTMTTWLLVCNTPCPFCELVIVAGLKIP